MSTLRFTDHYGLTQSQAELDFVDIPLDTDIHLCVDPYAISLVDSDPWFVECNNLVVDFFQLVVDCIRSGDKDRAYALLSNLHEPNETRLGLSTGRPSGRGIGRLQAVDLYDRLSKSRAVRTGKLRHLSDCELHIPQISSDKISDITINIIRGKLIEYTAAQCAVLGVPTRMVPTRPCWDEVNHRWRSAYADLPVYKREGIVLAPKSAVRLRLAEDHRDYYRHFVLEELQTEYLRAEHSHAATGLVQVLKNGKRKVYKKDLAERYPCSKDFLFEFSDAHPHVLDRYKASLKGKARQVLSDEQIEGVHPAPRAVDLPQLGTALDAVQPGRSHAERYHGLMPGILGAIFHPDLRNPTTETPVSEGRKRIDIVFTNRAERGMLHELKLTHGPCLYVPVECKNYDADPANPELDQLTGRFTKSRGMLGLLVCRHVRDRRTMVKRCRDIAQEGRGYVLVLDDADIKELLQFRSRGLLDRIDTFLDDRFRELVM